MAPKRFVSPGNWFSTSLAAFYSLFVLQTICMGTLKKGGSKKPFSLRLPFIFQMRNISEVGLSSVERYRRCPDGVQQPRHCVVTPNLKPTFISCFESPANEYFFH